MRRRRLLVPVIVCAVFLVAQPVRADGPVLGVPQPAPPKVGAASWILYDATYGVELGSLKPDTRRAMASTTKIMSMLVARDHGDLDDWVTVSRRAASIGEAEIGLEIGERWTLRQLLSAMAVRSANDAAVAVAEHIGGSVEGFAAMMNAKAQEMGLENTHFVNPHGLDAPKHYSSARDLLIMGLAALDDPFLARAFATRSVTLPDDAKGHHRVATATNHLLDEYDGSIGLKTGYTFKAALVLVAAAERDGRRLLAVVMGSRGSGGHFRDAAKLLDYGFNDFSVVPLIIEGGVYANTRVPEGVGNLKATATVETLAHLAGAGLLGLDFAAGEPAVTVEGGSMVGLDGPDPPPLPGVEDALTWVDRYWNWLVGGS